MSVETLKSIVDNKVLNSKGQYDLEVIPIAKKFHSDETNYGIYLCYDIIDETSKPNTIAIVGIMPRLIINKKYFVTASLVHHETWGEQFNVLTIECDENNSAEDEKVILAEFVSTNVYERIIEIYEYPITAILNNELNYKVIYGLGKIGLDNLYDKIIKNQDYLKAYSALAKYGLSFNIVKKIVNHYKSSDLAVQNVKENPYVLYHDIKGIGFLTADTIAASIGLKADSQHRKLAGLVYALELKETMGNIWSKIKTIKNKAMEVLNIPFEDFDDYLSNAMFYTDDTRIALKKLWKCENNIAVELSRIFRQPKNIVFDEDYIYDKIIKLEQELKIMYSLNQRKLFYEVNKSNVVVLIGSAGTGKTFCLNGCLKIFESKYKSIMLVSPTAKAAKVLSKSTGREATTIHRGLLWQQGNFQFNKDCQLMCDLLIIDEASMIDIFLFRSLVQAVPDGCTIVLVGDTAQLESISVGNVLHDIINSGIYPVVALTDVFRQALDSGILYAATKVNEGSKMFYAKGDAFKEIGVNKDFKIWFGEKNKLLNMTLSLFKNALKIWSVEDILVISPMKKGDTGVINLNKYLQVIANPADDYKKEIESNNIVFRVGDKVRHTKNNYNAEWLDVDYNPIKDKTGVFNGDFGIVYDIVGYTVYVNYGDKIIEYKKCDQLDLAYAITTHSSQGSQSPVVICVIDISHYMNLKRNLVYTMMTRAENRLYMIAEERALSMAIDNNTIPLKQTFLEELIKESEQNET